MKEVKMFELEFSNQAKKFLSKCEDKLFARIKTKLNSLKENSVPSGSKFIGREENEKVFRYRIGKCRVLYKVKNKENTILITKIDKREKVYN